MLIHVSACQQKPVRFDQQSEAFWKARALIRDKINRKSQIINIEINARKDTNIRIDAISTLGDHLASFVLSRTQLTYVNLMEKKYYQGVSSKNIMKKLIGVRISPQILHNVFFDTPLTKADWSCTKGTSGFLSTCENKKNKMQITWSKRERGRKNIKITHKHGVFQMNLRSYKPEVETRQNLFVLRPPKTFKSY